MGGGGHGEWGGGEHGEWVEGNMVTSGWRETW